MHFQCQLMKRKASIKFCLLKLIAVSLFMNHRGVVLLTVSENVYYC